MNTDIPVRIDRTRRYFELLSAVIANDTWDELLQQQRAGDLDTWHSAVLIHPIWYEDYDEVPRQRLHRAFKFGVSTVQTCQARDIWGYDCKSREPLQIDHRFPFALGGPTVPENALYLCRHHNQLKGHDVHLNSWEPSEFAWLSEAISAVETLRANYSY